MHKGGRQQIGAGRQEPRSAPAGAGTEPATHSCHSYTSLLGGTLLGALTTKDTVKVERTATFGTAQVLHSEQAQAQHNTELRHTAV